MDNTKPSSINKGLYYAIVVVGTTTAILLLSRAAELRRNRIPKSIRRPIKKQLSEISEHLRLAEEALDYENKKAQYINAKVKYDTIKGLFGESNLSEIIGRHTLSFEERIEFSNPLPDQSY